MLRKNLYHVHPLTWCQILHLAKAAFPQHSEEGEVREFDLVHDVGGHEAGLSIRLRHHLLAWAQLGFLKEQRQKSMNPEAGRRHKTDILL